MIFPNIILKVERWKFNKDYGVYVSTLGRFKDRHKRLLPIKINQHGYCAVKTERGTLMAHRLVMFTWRPIPDAEHLTVDHLNHNKRDNSVINLEWVTKDENLRRAKIDLVTSDDKAILNDYLYIAQGRIYESIEEAYSWIVENGPKALRKQITLENLTNVYNGLASALSTNNFVGSQRLYGGMAISVIKKGQKYGSIL